MNLDKKSLLAIEKIISCINELKILTKNRTAEYFYDSFELNALLDLLGIIESNLNKISKKIKEKYSNIEWEIIIKQKDYDKFGGTSLNIGKAWELVSITLKDALLDKLINLLELELPNYYANLCNRKHKEFISKKIENKKI